MDEICELKQKRGMLTERIKEKSIALLGYEVSVVELRLMPYLMTVMMNYQKIDTQKINKMEFGILRQWRQKGFISTTGRIGENKIMVTEDFWNKVCKLVYYGYVDI